MKGGSKGYIPRQEMRVGTPFHCEQKERTPTNESAVLWMDWEEETYAASTWRMMAFCPYATTAKGYFAEPIDPKNSVNDED